MKKKVGIIGYGWVAGENHRWSYQQAKDVEIVAVCDVKKDALERAKKDFGLSDDRLFDVDRSEFSHIESNLYNFYFPESF